jgi:hypothetical protein
MVLLDVINKPFLLFDFLKVSECLDKVLPERLNMWILFLELIDTHGIRYRLNQTSSGTSSNDIKWLQPELKAMRFKDGLEFLDQLGCELLLCQIIRGLYDD